MTIPTARCHSCNEDLSLGNFDERHAACRTCTAKRLAKARAGTDHTEYREALGKAWSAYLGLLMNQRLEDDTPVFSLVLALNSDLAAQLRAALT